MSEDLDQNQKYKIKKSRKASSPSAYFIGLPYFVCLAEIFLECPLNFDFSKIRIKPTFCLFFWPYFQWESRVAFLF